MNQDFPLFSLTQPQTAQRRSAKSSFVPLPAEKIEQRQEKANNLRRQAQAISRKLQEMSPDERKTLLIKLEHEKKISLSGTDLKSISESNHFTLAVPRTENLDNLEKKIDEFGEGELKKGQPDNPSLAYLNSIKEASPKDRLCQIFFEQYDELIQQDSMICEIEMMSLQQGKNQQSQELLEIRREISCCTFK